MIEVTLASSPAEIGGEWPGLVARAAGNAFMDPACLAAALAAGFGRIHVLVARDPDASPRLVGVWALAERRLARVGPRYLAGPPHPYAFVSNPVVDAARADEVAAAFLTAIRAARRLPRVLRLNYLDGSDPACAALRRAVGAGGMRSAVLSDRERAFALRSDGQKRSGSATRKKLRQGWNRLSAEGTVAIVNDRGPAAVVRAFEAFLVMEAASWKGGAHTAILSHARDAAFARRMIAGMAAAGNASVALLTLGGRPIAAQVLLYSGTTAYTWKTAFDAAFARFSPGALLVDRVADMLFAETPTEAIDSCSPEGGFMATLWTGRRQTVDLLVDCGARRSPAFTEVSLAVAGRARLKRIATDLNSRLHGTARTKAPAVDRD